MANLGDFTISMRLLTAKFNASAKDAGRSLKTIEARANAVGGSLAKIGAAAGVAAVAGMSVMLKNAIRVNTELYDMTVRLGATAEGLSRLQYAADQTGVSQQTLFMALQRSTRRIAEAAQGTGEAVKALDELGLSAKNLVDLAPEKQFSILSDAIQGVEAPADRVRLAMKLFDSEGVKLVQTMQGGSKALAAFAEESDRLGTTVSTEAATAAKQASDAFTRLSSAGTGLANSLLVSLGPTLTELAEWLTDKIPAASAATTKAFKYIAAGALEFAQVIASAALHSYEVLAKLPGKLGDNYALAAKQAANFEQRLFAMSAPVYDSIAAGGAAFDEKFTPAAQKAIYTMERFNLAAGESNAAKTFKASGGTGPIAKLQKAANDKAKAQLESVRVGLLSEEQALAESYERRLLIIDDANRRGLISDQKLKEMSLQLDEKLEKDRKNMAVQQMSERLSYTKEFFGNLAFLANNENSKLAEIGRAAAIVQATIDGALAAQKAYAQGGPIAGPIMAAAMAGVTAVNVATIAGARATGGPVASGKTYLVGEKGPELLTMGASGGNITPNNQLGGAPVINIQNYGAEIETTQDGNQVNMVIRAAKAAVFSEFEAGSNQARSFERRYGLTRRAG